MVTGMTPILVPYHLDEHLPELGVPVVPERTVTRVLTGDDTWSHLAGLYDDVAAVVAADVRAGSRPVVMSGDCTTSLGIVAGLQRAGQEPAIVWLDAHGDLQTPETTASGYLGGMPLRLLAGSHPELVADSLGLHAIAEDRIVLAGARDLDPPEREYLAGSAIVRREIGELGPGDVPAGPVYLHVDFDVADPEALPNLLYPTSGGPGLAEVAAAVGRVLDTGRVVAIGLGCTWRPGGDDHDAVRDAFSAVFDVLHD